MAKRRRVTKSVARQLKLVDPQKDEATKLLEHARKKNLEKGSEYLRKLFMFRAKIGNVALEAIEMQWAQEGFRGRMPSEYRCDAIYRFAKDLGVSFTLLYDWIHAIEVSRIKSRKKVR